MSLIFVMTDIHGHLDHLTMLVDKCLYYAADHHVSPQDVTFRFLGDYIDKGTHSRETVAYLRSLDSDYRCIFLQGNHERMLIDALQQDDGDAYLNAGSLLPTLRSYGFRNIDLDDDLLHAMRADTDLVSDAAWFETMPIWDEDEHRIYVHAGINPYVLDMSQQRPEIMLWVRNCFLDFKEWNFPKRVVHGHSPHTEDPNCSFNNRTNLDTGVTKGGTLTAGVFDLHRPEALDFIQVTAAEVEAMEFPATLSGVVVHRPAVPGLPAGLSLS